MRSFLDIFIIVLGVSIIGLVFYVVISKISFKIKSKKSVDEKQLNTPESRDGKPNKNG